MTTIAANSTGLIIACPNGVRGGNFSTNPWQRGTSFTNAFSSVTYTADRWLAARAGTGDGTVAQRTVTVPSDFPVYSPTWLGVTVTTAEASLATGSSYSILYRMEGYDWANFYTGALTFSFYVISSLTGTYSLTVSNNANTYNYIATYTINAANTVEYKTITIPAMPGAAPNVFTNSTGLNLRFSLAAGSAKVATPGSWANPYSGDAATGQTNLFATVSNNWAINLIKMEAGTIATPYVVEDVGNVLRQCTRYYRKTYIQGVNPGTITDNGRTAFIPGTNYNANVPLIVERFPTMRSTPTVTFYSPTTGTAGQMNVTSVGDRAGTAVNVSDNSFNATTTAITAGNIITWHYVANAEL